MRHNIIRALTISSGEISTYITSLISAGARNWLGWPTLGTEAFEWFLAGHRKSFQMLRLALISKSWVSSGEQGLDPVT